MTDFLMTVFVAFGLLILAALIAFAGAWSRWLHEANQAPSMWRRRP